MDISIQNFELTFKMTNREFDEFLESMKSYDNNRTYDAYSSTRDYEIAHDIRFDWYSFSCFQSIGIPQWTFTKVMNLSRIPLSCTCKLLVDINDLMESVKHSYAAKRHTANLDTIPEVLQYHIGTLFPEFKYLLESRKLVTVNYYTSIKMRSKGDLDEYYKLLKKYNYPPYLAKYPIAYNYYNEIEPEIDFEISSVPEGITIKCYSYELRIYPVQVPKIYIPFDYIPDYSKDETNVAEGELRIELCAKRPKLYGMMKGEKLQDEFDLLLTSKPMAVFIKNLKAMYGSGDFYSLDKAQEIVEMSHYDPGMKEELLAMLDYVSSVNTLNQSLTCLDNETQKKCMKKFNKMDLSPITIPADFNRDYYPNPIKYLMNEDNIYLADN